MAMNIITDECWPELISGKDLKIEYPFLKAWEYDLKKKIYRLENIHDDVITTDKIYIPIDYAFTEWVENRIRPFAPNNKPYESDGKTATAFHPCIPEYDDWDKLVRKPELKYIYWKKSEQDMNILTDIFGDILDVQQGEPFYSSIDTMTKGWGLTGRRNLRRYRPSSLMNLYCPTRSLWEKDLAFRLTDAVNLMTINMIVL